MRAVIRRGGALVVDEMAPPEPGAGQVLVKSLVCGICGSDLHALDHYDHMIDLTAKVGGFSQMTKGADTVFGHEFCCEVLENGPQTAGRFHPGARVVSIPGLLRADGADTVAEEPRRGRHPLWRDHYQRCFARRDASRLHPPPDRQEPDQDPRRAGTMKDLLRGVDDRVRRFDRAVVEVVFRSPTDHPPDPG